MTVKIVFDLIGMLLVGGILGAMICFDIVQSPSHREQALEAKLDAMKRANYLSAEFFDASTQLRDQMAQAASSRRMKPTRGRAYVNQPPPPGDPTVIDGDWLS